MKQMLRIIALPFVMLLLSHQAIAADEHMVGIVNVTDLFNSSSFVQKANKELQDNAKKMDETLKKAQAKLQGQINEYQTMKNANKKGDMAKKISDEQSRLSKMAQEYQQKVQEEQNKGMQEFTQLVRVAVEKVAKEKNIHHVLNSTSLIYTDTSWVDVTKDVAAEMAKK